MISYLQFLLKSTNQHGVHSPFVFNYLTKGLYAQKKIYSNENDRSERLILSTIAYLGFKKIDVRDEVLQQKIQSHFPQISITNDQPPFDLSITRNPETISMHKEQMHNDSILILQNPSRQLRKNSQDNASGFTLILDLYHTIVLSVRHEQRPQTFYLRY